MKINKIISIHVENRGVRRIFGNLISNYKIDPYKIVVSINHDSQTRIDLDLLFPQNHKIKKIFLLEMDDYYFLVGHYKEDKMVYNVAFSNILLDLNIEDCNKNALKYVKPKNDLVIENINYFLDKINHKGINSLNMDEKKRLDFLSKKLN